MKEELQIPIARNTQETRWRAETPHPSDSDPAHLLSCAPCRAYFRSTLEVPDNLGLLFGGEEPMLTCLRQEETEAYLLGRCSPLEQKSIEMHLAECAPCLHKMQCRSRM